MEDDGITIKSLIEEELSKCNDTAMLDLIYKLLIASNQ